MTHSCHSWTIHDPFMWTRNWIHSCHTWHIHESYDFFILLILSATVLIKISHMKSWITWDDSWMTHSWVTWMSRMTYSLISHIWIRTWVDSWMCLIHMRWLMNVSYSWDTWLKSLIRVLQYSSRLMSHTTYSWDTWLMHRPYMSHSCERASGLKHVIHDQKNDTE